MQHMCIRYEMVLVFTVQHLLLRDRCLCLNCRCLILQVTLRAWDYCDVLGKGRLQSLDITPPKIVKNDPCLRNPYEAAVAVSAKKLPPQSLCYCYF